MKTLIIITALLFTLGASGWFGWQYYDRNNAYKKLGDEEIALCEEKSALIKNINSGLKEIENSDSLESIHFNIENCQSQLSDLNEKLARIRNSGKDLQALEEEKRRLEQELSQKTTL